MSRIEELKKQNPLLSINYIDTISTLLSNNRYVEMVVNLLKNDFKSKDNERHKEDIIYELVTLYNMEESTLKKLSFFELYSMIRFINEHIGSHKFKTLTNFIDLNERKLITNNDLTAYKDFDELELQNSLANLKLMDKELEIQAQKIYDTDEWLVVKPLSYFSSVKYGAGTKWCTSSSDNPEYYLKYARRGILIYCINKKTGNKVAAYKNLDNDYEKEISFWDIKDLRIDSIESGLPNEIMEVIKFEFLNVKMSNWDFLTEKEKNTQLMSIEKERNKFGKTAFLAPRIEIISEDESPVVNMPLTYEQPNQPQELNINGILTYERPNQVQELNINFYEDNRI